MRNKLNEHFGIKKPKKQGDDQKPCTHCGYKPGDGKYSCIFGQKYIKPHGLKSI